MTKVLKIRSDHSITVKVATQNNALCKSNIILTISVRQAGVAAHCAVTLEDDRPLDRRAGADRNVKFQNLFNTNLPLCGTTCYILPSRTMSQLFNGGNCVYHSVEVY